MKEKSKIGADVVVTDYGVVRISPKVIEGYTGAITLHQANLSGPGQKKRRAGVAQLVADVSAASRLFWTANKDIHSI